MLKMEVSGRKEYTLHDIKCQPCKGDGDIVQAQGYCENCNEFICSSCIKAHLKLAVTKNHVIKNKDEMPRDLATQSPPCTELCDVHKNEIMKFYCQEHDIVGCGDCMVLEHTSCKVQLVSDVSCNYDDSDELAIIKRKIAHLKKNLASCEEEIKRSLKTADEIKVFVIKEIEIFRREMDSYLDKVRDDLIQEVEKINADDIDKQQTLQSQCEKLSNEIERFQRKLEQCNDNVNNLFVRSKKVQTKLQSCYEINEDISAKSQINLFKFIPSDDMNVLKINNTCLGILDKQVKKFSGQCNKSIINTKTHFARKFNIQTKNEAFCGITGMTVISDAEILCSDAKNKSLKVLNHKDGKITSTLKLSSFPADVITIDATSAATTLYHKGTILFLNTQNGLSTHHSLKVRERCLGIDHFNGKIAVSFVNPPAVQVLDMEGHIIHQISDTSILERPYYVSLSNNNERMYVSYKKNGAVYEFTLQGHLITTYKSEVMKHPVGLTVTKCGNIVVCDSSQSAKVGVIVPETKEILPLHVEDVKMPRNILICEKQGKMFVSEYFKSEDHNYIKVYDLKY